MLSPEKVLAVSYQKPKNWVLKLFPNKNFWLCYKCVIIEVMTITSKDIKNLASLARIEISEEEAERLTPEIDSILGYVGQIKNVVGNIKKEVPKLHNVMREDVSTNTSRQYTDDILNNAPDREGDYIKVKKIL